MRWVPYPFTCSLLVTAQNTISEKPSQKRRVLLNYFLLLNMVATNFVHFFLITKSSFLKTDHEEAIQIGFLIRNFEEKTGFRIRTRIDFYSHHVFRSNNKENSEHRSWWFLCFQKRLLGLLSKIAGYLTYAIIWGKRKRKWHIKTFGLWKSLDKVRIQIRMDPHRTGFLDPKQRENLGETATQQ